MTSKDIAAQKYVAECLRLGRVTELAAEGRRGIRTGWVPVKEQHAAELARMNRICDTTPVDKEMVLVAIDPDDGRIALLMVNHPNDELDFHVQRSSASRSGDLESKEEAIAANVLESANAAIKIVEELKAGTIRTLEDLSRSLPSDVSEDTVKTILSSASQNAIDLETLSGRVRLGGVDDLVTLLPSETSHVVNATIRSIDDDARKTGLVGFKISQVNSSTNAIHRLAKGRHCHATLRSSNNTRTLRLFDFARWHSAEVTLELKLMYQIKTQRMEMEIVSILNEDALLKMDRPVQQRLADF